MYAGQQRDDVSNIHRRWSLTRFNPSSFSNSLAISVGCVTAITVLSLLVHLQAGLHSLAIHLPLALAAVGVGHLLDFVALRGTPINKLSKVSHVAAFSNILWLLTVSLGIAADIVFGRPFGSANYIVAGMFLAVGLRIGIFTSVFGAGTMRAIGVSFIQPVLVLFAMFPVAYYPALESAYVGAAFGATIVGLGIGWTFVADRAGRPSVTSTFRLLQAFLSAWSDKKVDKIEEFTESRAHEEKVTTTVIRFSGKQSEESFMILPDVHPGPFGAVGGSNLPYVLFESFGRRALVMHSVSDHSLNIPSQKEVAKYVQSLGKLSPTVSGVKCAMPVQIKEGAATATGLAFGDVAVLFLSLAPSGMDDIPDPIRKELDSFAAGLKISKLLVVDCHNAMGDELTAEETGNLIKAGKSCLQSLAAQDQSEFSIGFSRSSTPEGLHDEMGQAGVGVMVIGTQGRYFGIGWTDANNMQNSLRDKIISALSSSEISMLEVCTSDTHATAGKRTKEGYYELGSRTDHAAIVNLFGEALVEAKARLSDSSFELSVAETRIRVMGVRQFEDYSRALDGSIKVTKAFLMVTAATFVAMLVFSY
ncbi:MAG: DUF2070 family protein [Nitrososphaera sp.]